MSRMPQRSISKKMFITFASLQGWHRRQHLQAHRYQHRHLHPHRRRHLLPTRRQRPVRQLRQLPPRPPALRSAHGPSRLRIPSSPPETPWPHKVATSIVSAASPTTPLSQTLISTPLRPIPGRPSPPFRHRVVGSAPQATAPISTCLAAWTKTSRRRPRFGVTTRAAIPITRAFPLIPSQPTSTPLPTSTGKSIALPDVPSAQISTSRFTILPQIAGRWLPIIRLPTTASWRVLWAALSMAPAATPFLTRLIATIQAPTRGTIPQSPICLRAARPPPPVSTTAGRYLHVAAATSPSAP